MAKRTTASNPQRQLGSWMLAIGRRMLLIPEAIAIVLLLFIGTLFPNSGFVGIAIGIVTCWMVFRIGALYLTQKLLEQEYLTAAERLGRFAFALHPWSADALALRGVIALSIGEFDNAAEFLRRSLALYPESAATQVALSGTLLMIGRPATARLAAQNALMLDPQRAVAYLYLAEAEHVEGHSVLEIEDTLRSGLAIAVRPDDQAALRCTLGGLLLSQGRQAEASLMLNGIESLINLCSPAAKRRLRMRYGELLIAQGQIERAREYLQQSQLVKPLRSTHSGAWESR
jgi:predicted Zn-dependent protease